MSLHTASSSPNRHLCHPLQDPQGGQGSPLLIRPALTPTQKILYIHTFRGQERQLLQSVGDEAPAANALVIYEARFKKS